MPKHVFQTLYEQQLITSEELEAVEKPQPLSVHRELIAILYAGIIMLTTGAGILVYKNINTISHEVLIVLIALASIACFVWCIKKSKGFSVYKVETISIMFDYILLLGCLLLLICIAYAQYIYNIFGNSYGAGTFIPMVILFITAYYFDHLGILSLAITNLAAWAGLTVTPLQVFNNNNFDDKYIIITAIALGSLLMLLAYLSVNRNIKAHFAMVYKNFATHLLFIGLLAAIFHFNTYYLYLLWFIMLAVVCFAFYKQALKEHSFYYLVITFIYGYIGLSYVVLKALSGMSSDSFMLISIYFIASGIGLINRLIYYNKALKHDTDL